MLVQRETHTHLIHGPVELVSGIRLCQVLMELQYHRSSYLFQTYWLSQSCSFTSLQPEAAAASSLRVMARAEEEDDGDLNKALGVQRFQQILSPASRVPDEQHRNYHEEDIECKHAGAPSFIFTHNLVVFIFFIVYLAR